MREETVKEDTPPCLMVEKYMELSRVQRILCIFLNDNKYREGKLILGNALFIGDYIVKM